jgi:predicted transcriptional regulator
MTYIKVKDREKLLRDANSSGIVNNDDEQYKNYVNSYIEKINNKLKMENFESELSRIKDDISEIKDLLKKMLNS